MNSARWLSETDSVEWVDEGGMGIRYPRTRLHGFARCDGSGHCVVFPFPQAYRPSPSGGPGLCLHSGGVARVLGFGCVFWSSDPYLV
jgi:hypothetical protein